MKSLISEWVLVAMLLCRCGLSASQMLHRTGDAWNETVFFNCAITNKAEYVAVNKSTRCECRMMCSVNPSCTSVTVVPSPSGAGVECRTSQQPLILDAGLEQKRDAVTFYKSGPQTPYYPSRRGLFYKHETDGLTMVEARKFCSNKYGRLAVLHSRPQFEAAVLAAKALGSAVLMVDLSRTDNGKPHIWGDGTKDHHTEVIKDVFEFNNKHGMALNVDEDGLRALKETAPEEAQPFLCQYNPCRVDW